MQKENKKNTVVCINDMERSFNKNVISRMILQDEKALLSNIVFNADNKMCIESVIKGDYNNLHIKNCKFKNFVGPVIESMFLGMQDENKTKNAIEVGNKSNENIQLIIEDCVFENCKGPIEEPNGIITVSAGENAIKKAGVLIKNCEFHNCESGYAMLRVVETSENCDSIEILLQNCIFDNCKNWGYSENIQSNLIIMNNCELENCSKSDVIYYTGKPLSCNSFFQTKKGE